MPRELTARARRNVENGATAGPGTPTCRKCSSAKEPSRLNSAHCSTCDNGGRITARVVTVRIPADDHAAITATGKTPEEVAAYYLSAYAAKHRVP